MHLELFMGCLSVLIFPPQPHIVLSPCLLHLPLGRSVCLASPAGFHVTLMSRPWSRHLTERSIWLTVPSCWGSGCRGGSWLYFHQSGNKPESTEHGYTTSRQASEIYFCQQCHASLGFYDFPNNISSWEPCEGHFSFKL